MQHCIDVQPRFRVFNIQERCRQIYNRRCSLFETRGLNLAFMLVFVLSYLLVFLSPCGLLVY